MQEPNLPDAETQGKDNSSSSDQLQNKSKDRLQTDEAVSNYIICN